MVRRASSDLLLVGSLPASTTDEAFRLGAQFFGDLVFALPDGETGRRATWVGYERDLLLRKNPDIQTVKESPSPTGFPRHAYENPIFAIKPGASHIHFDTWPRIDDAIASYKEFRALRDQGVIRKGIRFQIGLPFPTSVLNSFRNTFAKDYPVAAAGYEELIARELVRLTKAIPPEDLAIQWDVCYEVLDLEGVMAWTGDGAWERFTGPAGRLTRLIPEGVLVGYHFCYGTFPQWPMYEARDMELIVRMANHAAVNSGRTVDWFHLAGPRYLRSEDERFFRPLSTLKVGDTRVFLGIVLPMDGEEGLRRRYTTASRFIKDFGVAMYCGFGRQPGADGVETMREHAQVVKSIKG